MHAQELRDLAGVEGIVGEKPHEHRLSRVPLGLPADLAREFFAEHREGPSLQRSLDDLPRRLEREDELVRTARHALVVLPAHAAQWIGEWRVLSAALLEYAAQPVNARASGVSGDSPDRPFAGRDAKLQLIII